MKEGIYHTQLQWRMTPKNTKHVCLLISTCSCNYGSTEWRRWGFTEHIAADSAVAFQLKRHQSLAPLFSPGLHRGAAICHMARSHTSCTQCIQYMNRETNKREKKKKKTDPGNKRAVARTFTQHKTRKRAHAHSLLLPSWARSFLLQQHKSYHAGCQGEREGNGEGERHLESDCCGATLVYFSQFSFLGHRVCVQCVCVCVCVCCVPGCVCVYSLYYSRHPVELQFRKTRCGSLKETCICWLKVFSEGAHMYTFDHANSLTQTRLCLSTSCWLTYVWQWFISADDLLVEWPGGSPCWEECRRFSSIQYAFLARVSYQQSCKTVQMQLECMGENTNLPLSFSCFGICHYSDAAAL